MTTHVSLDSLIALKPYGESLAFPPRHRVSALFSGGHLSIQRGRGIDFDEVRRYQPGDDIRAMDWRVTARTGHPHTKIFHEERERPVYLLVDYRSTMVFGTRRTCKHVLAAEFAALLAWSARKHGDRVGGWICSDQHQTELPPAGGDRGVLRFLYQLVENQPPLTPSTLADDAPLLLMLTKAIQKVHPGDALLIFSDFYNLTPTVETLLSQIARRADLSLIHVSDAIERHSPPPGTYPISDGRQPGLWQVEKSTADNPVRRLYQDRLDHLTELSLQQRIKLFEAFTEHHPTEQLKQFRHTVTVRGGRHA